MLLWYNLGNHDILNMSLHGMSRNSSGDIVPEPRWISKECQRVKVRNHLRLERSSRTSEAKTALPLVSYCVAKLLVARLSCCVAVAAQVI